MTTRDDVSRASPAPPEASPALQASALGVRAGRSWIVRDVSFDVRAGELVAVVGPNGAGKTTLLETLVGLRPADAGVIRAHGRALSRFRDFAGVFSFLPDAGTLPPEVIVRTLIDRACSLAVHDGPADALRRGLMIDPLLSKPIGILSRGEHQRVALFCSLVLGRPIAVLDEPFAAFDPLKLRNVLAAVRELLGPSTSIVASIHQLADAARIADRILILAGGKSVAFGDLASLAARAGNTAASLEDIFISLLEESAVAS